MRFSSAPSRSGKMTSQSIFSGAVVDIVRAMQLGFKLNMLRKMQLWIRTRDLWMCLIGILKAIESYERWVNCILYCFGMCSVQGVLLVGGVGKLEMQHGRIPLQLE
jgi:hypothetical protein